MRDAGKEIGRAVDRIDDPYELGVRIGGAAFLAEDAVIGIGAHDGVDDRVLGGAVDLRDEVVLGFLLDLERRDAVHRASDDASGPTRGAQGDVDEGMHEAGPSEGKSDAILARIVRRYAGRMEAV